MKYRIQIREKNPIITPAHIFTSIQENETQEQAIKNAKDFYTESLDTDTDQIEIVSITEIR